MFPDISSSFTGNFGSLGSSGAAKKFAGGMDPISGLFTAGNLAASIFGGIGQQRAAAGSLQSAADAQRAGAEIGAYLTQQQGIGQLADNIASRGAAERAAKLGYALQLRAENERRGSLFDKDLANAWQSTMRSQAAQLTPEAKLISQRENRRKMRETMAEKQAEMAGLFGRIAPQSATNLFA
jgi:hypothetical protein